jgi:hypothetical protein
VDGDDLLVTYETSGGWELVEAHLWTGTSLAQMPQTSAGNPKIGNFPYATGDITGETSYTFAVPLSDLAFSCPAEDLGLFVAAHAALRRPDGFGGYQTETGWGDGTRIVRKGNWATYFGYTLSCDCDHGGGEESCETAFAWGGSDAQCFMSLDLDADGNGDFSRWGWTQLVGPGSYAFDIYAAAGRCNLDNGTRVGALHVSYDGAVATVTYAMDEGFVMEESHLYVGGEILPRGPTGDWTVAPGQYPFIDTLGGATSHTVVVEGLEGSVYVVAHAVTCGEF